MVQCKCPFSPRLSIVLVCLRSRGWKNAFLVNYHLWNDFSSSSELRPPPPHCPPSLKQWDSFLINNLFHPRRVILFCPGHSLFAAKKDKALTWPTVLFIHLDRLILWISDQKKGRKRERAKRHLRVLQGKFQEKSCEPGSAFLHCSCAFKNKAEMYESSPVIESK